MRFLLFLFSCSISVATSLFAQTTLFESIEYKTAYEKGTRSRSGVPGPEYWQNHASYEIKAIFNPEKSEVAGHLRVQYFNNSPDSLTQVVFKLMQNLYQRGAGRQMPVDTENLHNGIVIENVTIDEAQIEEKSIRVSGTVMRLPLQTPQGKRSITIEMDFVTPVPKTAGFRSGHVDSTSVFVAYWFPQVAVYDDIFGWDTDEYMGIPEAYNDFSDYYIELTLPSEYNVWATGKHMNPKDIFTDDIIARIRASQTAKSPVTIISEEDFRQPDGKTHTWKFKADKVPDFAWGASSHYIWQGMAANNPDASHTCWVQSAWPQGATNFDWVVDIAKKSVEAFSTSFPGVPYPYFKHISFRGTKGGGMEFPMLANNDVASDSTSTILVTAHELAHNYYPFMMGVNERKYGWWDESMTTLMESFIQKKVYKKSKTHGFFNRKVTFNYLAASHELMPVMTETSNIMKVMPSIVNFYIKGAAAFDILIDLIGEDQFYSLNRKFMEIWKGKHPTPYDFFYFINAQTGRNLNWFWSTWFFSFGYPDPGIADVVQNDEYVAVTITNEGGFPVPFKLLIMFDDDATAEQVFDADVWKNNTKKTMIRIPVIKKVKSVALDSRYSYDANPANNSFSFEE